MLGRILIVYEDIKKAIAAMMRWRKGRHEDQVDHAVRNRDERAVNNLVLKVRKKRDARRKLS